jgi:septum formation protein
MHSPLIILASQSPRRRFFLEKLGLTFEVVPSDFDEYFNDELTPHELAEELGLQKALAVAKKYPDAVVIGGDSVVFFEGIQLGKPDTQQEAFERLQAYRNKNHQVITSVAVVCLAKKYQHVESSTSTITFGDYSDDFILQYVKTGNPMDKAGSYAVQHPMIQKIVTGIDGRVDSIVGLDTQILARLLKPLGIDIQPIDVSKTSLLTDDGYFV